MIRKINRLVWLCKFRDDLNAWDKMLYRDLESWKKKCNGIEWFIRLEKLKKNKIKKKWNS